MIYLSNYLVLTNNIEHFSVSFKQSFQYDKNCGVWNSCVVSYLDF